ncbi:TIGR01777 family oxidoreductase [Longimicrobium sp.]|uniref:TIGR01777 family oxidoreductase n=1 Tax=Longimicrobium sp. TaxID=2029185 RepID=UPI002B85333A|nr:TIGR01777 family oxidoreductase [Longimicrobium sp.]HSU13976.1 TIGR01777 family oxidoreductase [Longimicrobium sp.]
MKVVIPGGSGQVGRVLAEVLRRRGDEVVVLGRGGRHRPGVVDWDGRNLGAWADEVDGADAVINLAGRSVNCRYDKSNLAEMLASRVDSTRAVAQAIEAAARPPRVWLQASTATIYAHRFDAPNDEETGVIGGHEPGAPGYWRFSIEIAQAWERELAAASTPRTRRVAMRMAIVMAPDRGGTFGILHRITRLGLGGAIAGGAQYISWIHDHDLARAVAWLLDREDIEGPVNLAAPEPLPQREFMRALRGAMGVPAGVPATRWMMEIAAFFHRTDTELLLKSRRVVPTRLLDAGFGFEFPSWPAAARDLVARFR